MIYYSGITSVCMLILPSNSYYYYFQGWRPLKATDVEKNVMFQEETLLSNADLSKDKRSVYRNRKLSKADRLDLYAERPDLDLRSPPEPSSSSGEAQTTVPAKSAMKGARAGASKAPGTPSDCISPGREQQQPAAGDSGSEGGEGGDDSRRRGSGSSSGGSRRARERAERRQARVREKRTEAAAAPASREEKAAMLFQSHVQAGTLIVNSVAPAGGNEEGSAPVNRINRSRSSSFHSGVSDGKYDLLAPLLDADSKEPVASSSYPQHSSSSAIMWDNDAKSTPKKGFTLIPDFLGGTTRNPLPMDVVSAGFRSSSTERLVTHNPYSDGGSGSVEQQQQQQHHQAMEEGTVGSSSGSARERESFLLRTAEEKTRTAAPHRVGRQQQDGGIACDDDEDDDTSSSDESDDEDKELSIPINAL